MTAASPSHADDLSGASVNALADLATAAEESVEDQQAIARRVRQMILARRRGRSWREIFSAEQAPGLFSLCGRVLRRMLDSVGLVRRALAASLREEGVGLEQIGRLFGVSHQRVSRLLAGRRTEDKQT